MQIVEYCENILFLNILGKRVLFILFHDLESSLIF